MPGLRIIGTGYHVPGRPYSNHDLSRTGEPWLLVDRLGRLRQWFAYWLKDEKRQVAGTPASGSQ